MGVESENLNENKEHTRPERGFGGTPYNRVG